MLKWIGLGSEAGWWIAVASMAMLFAGLIAVPLVIVHLPADYFVGPRRAGLRWPRRWPWLRWTLGIAKNAVGAALLVLGALMLVLPGQGILTLLIAVALLDFPGKFRLQRWVVGRRGVLDSVNWVRTKSGREPFRLGR